MIDINSFKKILYKTQEELKTEIIKYFEKTNIKHIVGDGFIYAKGEIPIMLVAHLDTVHKQRPKEIYYDNIKKVMWSPQGIGGDDRCGVYMILKLMSKYKPYVLFTEDEEIGGVGAKKFVESIIKPKLKFIIELDRRGNKDCVFYDCNNELFQNYIEEFNFETAIGSYSDICTISDAWDIASVNLSSGYYNEHTLYETINIADMEKIMIRVECILSDDENNEKYFDYQKKVIGYQYRYNEKNNIYEDNWGYLDDKEVWHYWDEKDALE